MDRELLAGWLEQGLSLTEIGELTGRDASTVGYWVAKFGLRANGATKHAERGGLTRAQLEPLVLEGASTREIATKLGRSQSTVRHWLQRHGLRTTRQRRRFAGEKPKEILSQCRQHGTTRFILEGRGAYRCAMCRSAAVSEWRRRTKRRLVEAGGGACALCGYDEHVAALHFHHLDPAEKRFALSNKGGTLAFEKIRAEAEKCILLCANCHAEVEWGAATLAEPR